MIFMYIYNNLNNKKKRHMQLLLINWPSLEHLMKTLQISLPQVMDAL